MNMGVLAHYLLKLTHCGGFITLSYTLPTFSTSLYVCSITNVIAFSQGYGHTNQRVMEIFLYIQGGSSCILSQELNDVKVRGWMYSLSGKHLVGF